MAEAELSAAPACPALIDQWARSMRDGVVAACLGVVALEEPVTPDDFRFFDGCFLASTTNDLVPVSSIDEHRFALDALALVWKLKAGFQNYASEYAAAHPELRAG